MRQAGASSTLALIARASATQALRGRAGGGHATSDGDWGKAGVHDAWKRDSLQGRQEIDIIAEFGAGSIIAFEVKADAAPDAHAARHMAWLRDRLGKRFVGGVVLHTGPSSFSLGDGLLAAPISTLWAERTALSTRKGAKGR